MSNKSDMQKEQEDLKNKNVGISNDMPMIIKSPEPLANEMQKIKKLYIVCLVCLLIGVLLQPLLVVGIFGLMIVYCLDYHMVNYKRNVLRYIKFKFTNDVDNENLFITMQPVFTGKYKMLVERGNEGIMTITHDNYTYDIIIGDDSTFTIWWRMSLGKAVLPENKYKSYRKILSAMGIISYEIQNAYQIQ